MLIKEEADQRRSLSFSSLDFNSDESSIVDQGVYSGDDDAYIEINLDRQPQSTGAKSRDNENEEKKEGGDDDDLEFRVSFLEAALPFIGISSLPVDWPPATDKRKVPLFLLDTLEGLPADESMGDHRCRNNHDSKQMVVRMSRNRSRTASDGGGMMNMMVKFRYVMSFRWMVTSMLKIRRQQRQAVASLSPSSGADSSSNNQKMSRRRKKPPRQQVIGASNNAAEKSISSGLKLDAIKGVVASDHQSGGRRGGGKHSKSCPGSIKSSPLHHQGGSGGALVYSKDSSVQAAIAHCKKSFGRSEDFTFLKNYTLISKIY